MCTKCFFYLDAVFHHFSKSWVREVDNRLSEWLQPLPPSPILLHPHFSLKAGDLTFVWTMPALWSLKCSRVAAISISLAPATDRKLDWVQSGGVIQLTSVNLSLYWVPFGTAQRLKIITFIPGKAGMGATACFLIKYAKRYFGVGWWWGLQ